MRLCARAFRHSPPVREECRTVCPAGGLPRYHEAVFARPHRGRSCQRDIWPLSKQGGIGGARKAAPLKYRPFYQRMLCQSCPFAWSGWRKIPTSDLIGSVTITPLASVLVRLFTTGVFAWSRSGRRRTDFLAL